MARDVPRVPFAGEAGTALRWLGREKRRWTLGMSPQHLHSARSRAEFSDIGAAAETDGAHPHPAMALELLGATCMVVAIIGGGCTIAGTTFPVINSFPRQALLFVLGLGLATGGGERVIEGSATSVAPEPRETTSEPVRPQAVSWGPSSGRPPGLCVDDCAGFISWETVQPEVETNLLPQVGQVPSGSRTAVEDYDGKANWVVRVIGPDGQPLGDVWFGYDPEQGWVEDGQVRVGRQRPLRVWATFRRYSNGTYKRVT